MYAACAKWRWLRCQSCASWEAMGASGDPAEAMGAARLPAAGTGSVALGLWAAFSVAWLSLKPV